MSCLSSHNLTFLSFYYSENSTACGSVTEKQQQSLCIKLCIFEMLNQICYEKRLKTNVTDQFYSLQPVQVRMTDGELKK